MSMLNKNIDIEKAIKNILKQLNLKNEVELAERLGITKNAFSMLKRRKSLGTLIEKFIEKEIIVSFDQMVYEVEYDLKGSIELKIQNEIRKLQEKVDFLKN